MRRGKQTNKEKKHKQVFFFFFKTQTSCFDLQIKRSIEAMVLTLKAIQGSEITLKKIKNQAQQSLIRKKLFINLNLHHQTKIQSTSKLL